MTERQWTVRPGRKIKLWCFYVFCLITIVLGIMGLLSILYTLIHNGLPGLNWQVFTQNTPAPGDTGGLKNAMIGSVIMTGLGILIAAPIGILIATYLVDFHGGSRFSRYVRFVNDVMLSAPSIVIGLFAYALVVRPLGSFSGLAGAIALAIIALPMMVRSSEDVLYLVSPLLKEAAIAMGVARWRVTVKIVYKVALNGIITGGILALARIAGETAPLLFTALNNQFASYHLLKPMANLPVVIFQYAMSSYDGLIHLAWIGAFIVTFAILLLNLFARWLARERR